MLIRKCLIFDARIYQLVLCIKQIRFECLCNNQSRHHLINFDIDCSKEAISWIKIKSCLNSIANCFKPLDWVWLSRSRDYQAV